MSNNKRRTLIFVPGKNPKPPPAEHRAQLMRCLRTGMAGVDAEVAAEMQADDNWFTLVSWNSLFYHRYRNLEVDLPWIDRLLQQQGPNEQDMRDSLSWRLGLAALAYRLIDRMHWLVPLIPDPAVRASLREVDRYFSDRGGIGGKIRDLLHQPLRAALERGDRVLLVGHSMGSVIAWDCLWELWHRDGLHDAVDLWLTLGSPLGLRLVRKRLLGQDRGGAERYPGNVSRWINISAHGDRVSLDQELREDFCDMVSLGLTHMIEDRCSGVFNWFRNERGLNAHRSYGYLVNPTVAAVIAGWWRGVDPEPGHR